YFFTQIPHPMHKNSEMNAILSEGHDCRRRQRRRARDAARVLTFLHSWAHRLGLQRLASTMAIRVILSAMVCGGRRRRAR
ncbi:hypothetical protein K523DRAFT_242804, partial [Schizophyllum commune Tattone D]